MPSPLDLLWSGEPVPAIPPHLDEIFSGTFGSRSAKILVVGEAHGTKEAEMKLPFVGSAGRLLKEMLKEVGVSPSDCLFTNLINSKAPGGDMRGFLLPNERGATTLKGLRPNSLLVSALHRLDSLITTLSPSLIIACGNWPLWWLTEAATARTIAGYKVPEGIGNWAGSELSLVPSPLGRTFAGIPVLPIYHPATILRQHPWRVITAADLSRIPALLGGERKETDELIYTRPTVGTIKAFLDTYRNDEVTCDLETFGKRIHIVGLGYGNIALSIPFFHILTDGSTRPTYSKEEFIEIYFLLREFFLSPTTRIVGQHFSYDIQYIARYFNATPKVTFDTMIAQHILFPALRGFKGLDSLSRFFCRRHIYWKDERKISTAKEDLERACLYNARDVLVTSEVASAQRKALRESGKMPRFEERMEVFEATRDMMLRGVRTNETLRRAQRQELFSQMDKIGKWLDDVIPSHMKNPTAKTPWYRSSPQTCDILYRKLKLEGGWDSRTGGYSADKEILAQIAKRYPNFSGFLSALILYKSLSTIASGYYAAPLGFDNRLRCSYNLAGPVTNRLASSEDAWGSGTNLQNILRERDPMDLLEQTLV